MRSDLLSGILNDRTRRAWSITGLVILAAYIAANAWYLPRENYILTGLPIVALTAWMVFYRPAWILVVIGFFTPISIRYEVAPLASTFNFPTEPLIVMLMLVFLFKLALDWKYDSLILKHPLTILILLNLAWVFVATVFSTMPIVSWKFLASRLWFVVVFYFLAVEIFRNRERIMHFVWGMASGLALVVLFALYQHRGFGFKQEYSGHAVHPLMNDHTEYGAVLGLLIPVIAGFVIFGKSLGLKNWQRITALVLLTIFLTGIFYSYSRASWLGLGAAAMMSAVLFMRIRFWLLTFVLVVSATLIYQNQYEILYWLSKNQQVSDSDFEQHVQSMYNITTDVSNTERINRWSAALMMYREKPFTGWGPGTYMFQYAPFQLSQNMTIISTRTGDLGNAHSEYLGPLSETGFPGLVTFALIVVFSIYLGMRLYYLGRTPFIRYMAMIVIFGLVTFYTHGFLNNFLEFDKVAVPFWSYLAVLTVLDLYNRGKWKEEQG